MSKALKNFTSTPVPQTQRDDPRQVKNNAGGFSFQVNDKDRLERFLILGTDGGTYYVGERELTQQNVDFVKGLIQRDAPLVLDTTAQISRGGRAFRNSPAIFTLNAIFAFGSDDAKSIAQRMFNDIVRTSYHLFEFSQYVENLGGWGRAKRTAVAGWYEGKDLARLAYQVVKYRQRNGWSHRDTLRLSHASVDDRIAKFVGRYYKDEQNSGLIVDETEDLNVVRAFLAAQETTDARHIVALLDEDYARNLPWEALPTNVLREPDVWKKLFYNGQLNGQALVRNITRLARIGAFNDMVFTRDYTSKLVDPEMIRRTRLHPINYLNALVVHTEGQIDRKQSYWGDIRNANARNKDWTTVPQIVDALNAGFHTAFASVEPANKRTMIAVDVSSSMESAAANGLDLSAAQVAAAEAMTIARTEPMYQVMGFATNFRDLGISPSMNLNEVLARTTRQNFGGTDCSLPMTYALANRLEVDTFVIITDNETWAGNIHVHKALQQYRQKSGIPARLAVIGVSATNFTIADPTDKGMMDFVGFDSSGPKAIAQFSAGRI